MNKIKQAAEAMQKEHRGLIESYDRGSLTQSQLIEMTEEVTKKYMRQAAGIDENGQIVRQ